MANLNGLVFPTDEELRKMTKRECTFWASRIIRESDGLGFREVEDSDDPVVFSTESLSYAVKRGQLVPVGLDAHEAFVAKYGFEPEARYGDDEGLPVGELAGFVLAMDQRRRRGFDPTDYDRFDKEGCFVFDDDMFPCHHMDIMTLDRLRRQRGYSYPG